MKLVNDLLLKYIRLYFLIFIVLIICGLTQGKDSQEQETNAWNNLVQEARTFDPAYAVEDAISRDEAISLYRKAIREYPDNPANIKLKHRIAQLYAFYSDPQKNVYPNSYLAAKEFQELTEQYPITELECLQSHIGLGGMNIIGGKMKEAVKYYQKVLDFNPEDNSEAIENLSNEKINEYYEAVESARLTSVDKIAYASIRVDPQYFLDKMKYIIDKYPETSFARKAQEHCDIETSRITNLENILDDSIEQLTSSSEIEPINTISVTRLDENSDKYLISSTERIESNSLTNKYEAKKDIIGKSTPKIFPQITIYNILYLSIGILSLSIIILVIKYRAQINMILGKKGHRTKIAKKQ